MQLISMTDFVLQQEKQIPNELNTSPMRECDRLFVKRVIDYAKFLKQPLKLEMFVPCDEDGNVLEEPTCDCKTEYDREGCGEQCFEYKNAKNKVLLEGFYKEFNDIKSPEGGYLDVGNLKHKTIETIVGAGLTLTPNAIKQLRL